VITGLTMQMEMVNGDGTFADATITMAANGQSFTGPWTWWRDATRTTLLGRGTFTPACHR
jgi:hypothetical protein